MFKEENPAKDIKSAETIIGPSVKVEGDFNSEYDIIIEGEVIGNIRTKSNLKIGKDAHVKAEITAKNAYISGSVVGNVTTAEMLHLTASATVSGNVTARLVMVETGAKLNGQCKMGGELEKSAPADKK